jgi:hypothetical protein
LKIKFKKNAKIMAEVKKSFPYRVSLRYMAIPKKLIQLEELDHIPEPELNKIIDICIDDHQLKDILTARKNPGFCNG